MARAGCSRVERRCSALDRMRFTLERESDARRDLDASPARVEKQVHGRAPGANSAWVARRRRCPTAVHHWGHLLRGRWRAVQAGRQAGRSACVVPGAFQCCSAVQTHSRGGQPEGHVEPVDTRRGGGAPRALRRPFTPVPATQLWHLHAARSCCRVLELPRPLSPFPPPPSSGLVRGHLRRPRRPFLHDHDARRKVNLAGVRGTGFDCFELFDRERGRGLCSPIASLMARNHQRF